MEQSLHLTRDSLSRPWGFRLQGGRDSGTSLVVQRVFSGSPAEGLLQRGDVVLTMDGRDCRHITHKDSLDIIRVSGGTLHLLVQRGDQNGIGFSALPTPTPIETVRPTAVTPRQRAAPWRPQSQFTTYASPSSPSQPRMTQSVYQDSYNHEEDVSLQNIESDPDYEFMHKSVSERRQLFNTPPSQPAQQKPRGRIQSYRPFTNFNTNNNAALGRRPEFGWCPSEEKMRAARLHNLASTSMGNIPQQQNSSSFGNKGGGIYSTATLPLTRQQHSSSVVMNSGQNQPAAYYQPMTARPVAATSGTFVHATVQPSQQLSSHVATLPRPARSYSTSHAPPSWNQTTYNNNYNHNSNDVFGGSGTDASRSKPLKINLYDNEPQQYSQHQRTYPAYPVNSPHGRSASSTNQGNGANNTRFFGALDGAQYRVQDGGVEPMRVNQQYSQPTVHVIRKSTGPAAPAHGGFRPPHRPTAASGNNPDMDGSDF